MFACLYFAPVGQDKSSARALEPRSVFWRINALRVGAAMQRRLQLNLLRQVQRLLDRNSEVANGALKLRVAQQKLHGSQVRFRAQHQFTRRFLDLELAPRHLRSP